MPPKLAKQIIEQEEQKIFKEFEEMGYEIEQGIIMGLNQVRIENDWLEIVIYKTEKTYRVWRGAVSMKVHQLLHKLFELWGWFNE